MECEFAKVWRADQSLIDLEDLMKETKHLRFEDMTSLKLFLSMCAFPCLGLDAIILIWTELCNSQVQNRLVAPKRFADGIAWAVLSQSDSCLIRLSSLALRRSLCLAFTTES
jgi:hypothetical protein